MIEQIQQKICESPWEFVWLIIASLILVAMIIFMLYMSIDESIDRWRSTRTTSNMIIGRLWYTLKGWVIFFSIILGIYLFKVLIVYLAC